MLGRYANGQFSSYAAPHHLNDQNQLIISNAKDGQVWLVFEDKDYLTALLSKHNPFDGLVLPESGALDERFLSLEEMTRIIESAPDPYKTFYWILAESGIRCGEACGLPTRNLLLDLGAIKIMRFGV